MSRFGSIICFHFYFFIFFPTVDVAMLFFYLLEGGLYLIIQVAKEKVMEGWLS